MLYGNSLIVPVVSDIASPDLKSPSYQDLILVFPSVGAHGNLNLKFYNIRRVLPGDAKIKSWHDGMGTWRDGMRK